MYLILKGTTVMVRRPNGQTKEHVTKQRIAIPTGAAKLLGYDMHYEMKGTR